MERVRSESEAGGRRPAVIAARTRDFFDRNRFARFLVVGVGNTVFGYTIFFIIYILSSSYRIAIVVATAIGAVFNFISFGTVVFRDRRISALVPFLLGYGVVCLVNIVLVDAFLEMAIPPLAGQVLAIPILVLLSYTINRRFVFGGVR